MRRLAALPAVAATALILAGQAFALTPAAFAKDFQAGYNQWAVANSLPTAIVGMTCAKDGKTNFRCTLEVEATQNGKLTCYTGAVLSLKHVTSPGKKSTCFTA